MPTFRHGLAYKYVGDMVRAARVRGFLPVISGKTIIMFRCPKCEKIKLVKFKPPENRRKRVHACICGHRKA